jgi:SpoVK/Ycf46/Vps4 family AAA+-type ATPase
MTDQSDPIRQALAGRHPLIYIHSAEEQRMVGWLERLAAAFDPPLPLLAWTCTEGLGEGFAAEDTRDPVAAIQAIVRSGRPGLYVMKDLSPFMDRPPVARALRDAYGALSAQGRTFLAILSPELAIPPILESDILLVSPPPPSADELAALVREVLAGYTAREPPAEWLADLALSLKGLTLNDARHTLHRAAAGGGLVRQGLLEAVAEAKKAVTGGAAYLQYVPVLVELDEIGGLRGLKDWVVKRTEVFGQRTLDTGLPIPKGILLMGISGCGKSLCAKAIARTWRVPLFRLDMNLVYGGVYGNPEVTFHKALRTVESAAPAVLWIDEIENGLGTTAGQDQTSSHILSAFLTWMQEKPPLIFVAATANRIEALPAEMIRKGRFDQVFFCDLPNAEERAEIFAIHIRHNQGDPQGFDMARLVAETKDWNAAEIEQAVVAARIEAAPERRAFGTEDILAQCRTVVPLSQTMREQIKFIRDWAWDRATPASGSEEMRLDRP